MKKTAGFIFWAVFILEASSCSNKATNPVPAGPAFLLRNPYSFSVLNPGSAGSFSSPSGVAVDSNNNIYVADSMGDRVVVYDSNRNYLYQWNSFHGSLNLPYAISVDGNNNIYISDNANNRVVEVTSNGSWVQQFGTGTKGSGVNQFNGPVGIAIGSNGNVYVADSNNNRVEVFGPTSNYLNEFDAPSGNTAYINHPQQLQMDANGDLYVACENDSVVKKFDSNGNLLSVPVTTGTLPSDDTWGILLDPVGGYLYVTDTLNNSLDRFGTNGNLLERWGGPAANSALGQFDLPRQIAMDSNRNIYVADNTNNRIEILSAPYNFFGLNTLGLFPNPVQSGQDAEIAFQLTSNLNFSITIKDNLGNLVNQYQGQGIQGDNILQWNMTNSGGSLADPGVYYVTFQSGSTQATQALTYTH